MKRKILQDFFKPIQWIVFIMGVVLLAAGLISCPPPEDDELECIDFEDPPLSTVYDVLDTFYDSGSKIIVQSFQWSGGGWTTDGDATITNDGDAGGSGQEIWTNNVNLNINFCESVEGVTLKFGYYGGNNNLIVNGDMANYGSFTELPATLGGVTVNVSFTVTEPSEIGTLELCGTIDSLIIGGQELAIDDICPGACD